MLARGAVTPKGYKGVTERIFVRLTVGILSAPLGSPLCGVSHRAFAERISAPLCILGKMFAPFHGVNIYVWRFAPNAGGVAALATINDGTSSLIEGELSSLSE